MDLHSNKIMILILIITFLSQTDLNIVNSLAEVSTESRPNFKNTNLNLLAFNFAAAGDWGCNEITQTTANSMQSKDPELVLALGDFSYQVDTGCWFNIMSPLLNKTRIVIGYHDFDTHNSTRLLDYVNKFNLTDPYYSFNLGNVHFLAMSSIIPFNNQSLAYKLLRDDSRQKQFVNDDLYLASQNKSIDWIVVYLYRPIYSSPSFHETKNFLRDSYHPLFDMYGVDLVLQAHNHNYQRSYPIKYNATNSIKPIVVDNHNNTYSKPNGTIFITVGTAGAKQHGFAGQAPYIAQQFVGHGFININITDNGTKMKGNFYDNLDGKAKDSFTIVKALP
jgi:hypothetical protein